MVLTFKESAFFEGRVYNPGDSIEKPQDFTIPPVYANAFHPPENREIEVEPKKRVVRRKPKEVEDTFDEDTDE